jgi:AcrR family transcriptional regulator
MATKTRTYSSNRRAAQAAQTRADVVAAAVDCFRANGWSGTTMNAVAEKAGVSVETVYDGF